MFRYNMLAPGDRVAAAVSGGADSVCLLSVLCELAGRLGVTVAGVAHLNHKLRGEASEEDERFVAALAARHGVPFYREEAAAGIAGGNLEQNARRERLKFFSRLIREGKADRIATGHTRDDQAETVLFRLLRGSGLAGLAGILPVTQEGLIRPLLDLSRAEVREFLRARDRLARGRLQSRPPLCAQPHPPRSAAPARSGMESGDRRGSRASGGSGRRGGAVVASRDRCAGGQAVFPGGRRRRDSGGRLGGAAEGRRAAAGSPGHLAGGPARGVRACRKGD
jgi:tRNA(Ile)-lysidine synthetase-like protein